MASEPTLAGGGGESAKAVPGGTTAGLAALTEELTLGILFWLDFKSLAATKRVCRRLSRIAHDPALFRRVSLIRLCRSFGPVLYTNCYQLDAVRLRRLGEEADEEGEAAFFHRILSRLVEGGAALSALDFSDLVHVGEILEKLPALLKNLRVNLRRLHVNEATPEQLQELVRSQPSLEQLDILCFPPEAVELVRSAPNLRHLRISDCSDQNMEQMLDPGLLRGVVPQLRSLSFYGIDPAQGEDSILPQLLSVLRVAGEGRLRLRAVGRVWAKPDGDVGGANYVVFAVEDFRMEERHSAVRAKEQMANPSLDDDEVYAFLRHVAKQQEKEAEERAKEKNKVQEAQLSS